MGHQLQLSWIARRIREKGHETVFALRRPKHISTTELASWVVPSPRWPKMAKTTTWMSDLTTCGPIDELGRLGLAEPGVFEAMLLAWDRCFAEIMPDAIVADSAPACLAAARGRVPTLAIGEGFSLPPHTMKRFPLFVRKDRQPSFDENDLLEAANNGLKATARDGISHLPQIYMADRAAVGTFRELDPYRRHRIDPVISPWLPHWEGGVEMKRCQLFAYLSFNAAPRRATLFALALLAAKGLPIALHVPNLDAKTRDWLANTQIRTEYQPLSLKEIQSRAATVLSFGSLGLASFALASGIPHIVIPNSIANVVTGEAIESLGAGKVFHVRSGDDFEPLLLAQAIERTYSDGALTTRAIELAPSFISRAFPPTAEVAASMVEELL